MQVEVLVDAKTETAAEEAVQEIQQLTQALIESTKATPSVDISDVQAKRGLFETTYFVSIAIDFAVGLTSGLATNLVYEYFKSRGKGKLSKKETDVQNESSRIEIDREDCSIIVIIIAPNEND